MIDVLYQALFYCKAKNLRLPNFYYNKFNKIQYYNLRKIKKKKDKV